MFSQVIANYSNSYDMMDGGSWGLSWLIMLFWMAVVVIAVVLIVRTASRNETSGRSSGEALEIVKKRFANGEITKKEYDEIIKALKV